MGVFSRDLMAKQMYSVLHTPKLIFKTPHTQVACFNMGSILIKPVQRILKYPLMLNELIKCTEVEHSDRADLTRARDIMTDVASFINESKRRKDIGKNKSTWRGRDEDRQHDVQTVSLPTFS